MKMEHEIKETKGYEYQQKVLHDCCGLPWNIFVVKYPEMLPKLQKMKVMSEQEAMRIK